MYKHEILRIVCNITNDKDIQYDTNLLEGIIADSLEIFRIIVELEAKFKIKFDMYSLDINSFKTVNDISNLVMSMK